MAAVLWLLAGMTVLAAMISQSSQILAQRQHTLRQRVDAELHFLETRSEVMYWLASSRATEDGFGWGGELLRVDGRSYAGAGKTVIQVQDVRGLLNLNRPNRARLERMLVRCGAAAENTGALLDALQDYIEEGELKRLNGAKSMEYSMAGMPPPRLAPLQGEPEVWRVFGWKSLQKHWEEKKCFEDVTVHGDGRFNIGTATAGVLEAYGLQSDVVDQVLAERDTGEQTVAQRVQAQAALSSFMGLAEGRFPSRTFRVTQSVPGMPMVYRYELRITTATAGMPWLISAPRWLPENSVTIAAGGASLPVLDQISETDKNAITQPKLPF